MSDIQRLIDDHLAAYADPDRQRRSAAVQRLWAEDAELVDPPLAARGHAQIVAQADQLLAHFPGHRFQRSSGIDLHHGVARYGWRLYAPDGTVALEGIDIAQLDARGRLARVTGFFGPLPALETAA
ncbi:MAG: nuclear transport factor 2 family protein [Rubrivivax sp.]|nr:nuclear transport factor 2 family protein [Rubrivivax sp.]